MADNGMRGRVKGLLAGTPPGLEPAQRLDDPPDATPAPHAQRDALQVLTLAQRTADEHIADAHHQADKIYSDARAAAEQFIREAEAHAQDVRDEADETLADARATAEQIAQEAQGQAEDIRQNADEILADARARAAEIAKTAQAHADELKHQAEQRYQEVVGNLATKRESLQQQIEALERFNHDYRARLTTFMQSQLRALWVDEPQVGPEPEQPDAAAPSAAPTTPAKPHGPRPADRGERRAS